MPKKQNKRNSQKNTSKKVTVVHTHNRHVPISEKNPVGITIVDQHLRRLHDKAFTIADLLEVFRNYDRSKIKYPAKRKFINFKNADDFDDLIAVWTDFFNKKFNVEPPLDPDVVKALIASESGFKEKVKNMDAYGIAQITKSTLHILQDTDGEAKDFTFYKIRLKDLYTSEVSIPLAIRWLFKKRELAASKLKRVPTHEEVILEYKGLLKSNSKTKDAALNNYRVNYATLKR